MSKTGTESRISIVVPAYNAAEFIRETLEHAIAQTYENIEILVIDDGSVDETSKIAESFGDVVRVIRTENRGVAKARNTGIEAATGEFIAFLDADDIWEPEKLRYQVEAVDDDHRLIYTNTVSFGTQSLSNMNIAANELLPSGDIRARLIQRNFISTSTVLLDRDIAVRIGGFNPDIPVCDDWDAWLRALCLTHAKYIDRPLVRYRIHPFSLGSNTKKRIAGSVQVIDSALERLDMSPKEKKTLKSQSISECYSYAAVLARAECRKLLAVKLFLQAYISYPSRYLVKEIAKTLIGPMLVQHLKSGKI